MQGGFAAGVGGNESPGASGSGPGLARSPFLRPGRQAIPTLRAVLVVLHVRRRGVRRRRGAGRRSRARAGAAAAAQFRQSPVGGCEFGSQVGHLLAGRLDRPIDAERELLIVFHHAQDFGLGAREVTKSCMMRGDWGARGRAPPALPVGSPAARLPRAPTPRHRQRRLLRRRNDSGASSPSRGGARRRVGEGGRGEEKEEEEQRSPRPRRGERLGEGHRAPPGTLSMEPTIRHALGRGQGPGAGALPRPPAPPTSGTHPLVGRVRRAVAQRGPRWRPWRGVGVRLFPGPLSVPSLERWGGPRPGELAP